MAKKDSRNTGKTNKSKTEKTSTKAVPSKGGKTVVRDDSAGETETADSEKENTQYMTLEEELTLYRNFMDEKDSDKREAAWKELSEKFERFIRWIVKRCLSERSQYTRTDLTQDAVLKEELWQYGEAALYKAVLKYDPDSRTKLTTFSRLWIFYDVRDELDFRLDPSGIKFPQGYHGRMTQVELPDDLVFEQDSEVHMPKTAKPLGEYSAERLTLQLLETLRLCSDKENPVSTKKLKEDLQNYLLHKHNNNTEQMEDDRTLNKRLAEMILELGGNKLIDNNKLIVNDENYFGKIGADKEKPVKPVKKAPKIKSMYYNHLFDRETMDSLIQAVCASDAFSAEDKNRIVGKLISTMSSHYYNPLWKNGEVRFDPKGISGRYGNRRHLTENIKIIQKAINHNAQIRFRFNRYNEKGELVPTHGKYIHETSPYHIVCYGDNFFLVGMERNSDEVKHFRIDLMTDVAIRTYEETGRYIPIEYTGISDKELLRDYWDPEKYLSEHAYMGYGKPEKTVFKVSRKEPTIYTLFRDWFGDHFEVAEDPNDLDSLLIAVNITSYGACQFALQNYDKVKVLNKDVRKEIAKAVNELNKKYGKTQS